MNGHATQNGTSSTSNGHHESSNAAKDTKDTKETKDSSRQNGAATPKEQTPQKPVPQDPNWTEEQELALVILVHHTICYLTTQFWEMKKSHFMSMHILDLSEKDQVSGPVHARSHPSNSTKLKVSIQVELPCPVIEQSLAWFEHPQPKTFMYGPDGKRQRLVQSVASQSQVTTYSAHWPLLPCPATSTCSTWDRWSEQTQLCFRSEARSDKRSQSFDTVCCVQVKALKQHGKDLEDRWEWIAKSVPGQTKTSCFKRFKQLRQAVRANKWYDNWTYFWCRDFQLSIDLNMACYLSRAGRL